MIKELAFQYKFILLLFKRIHKYYHIFRITRLINKYLNSIKVKNE